MHEEGDVPLLGEPWMFLSLALMVLACAAFILSVAFSLAVIIFGERRDDDSHVTFIP